MVALLGALAQKWLGHIRTGFGPQHGAKVFEDLLLDKAPEAAPK
jgi:hypothetical protein